MKVVLLSELKEGINKNPNLQYVHSILFELIDKLPTIDLEEIAERLKYKKAKKKKGFLYVKGDWVADYGEKVRTCKEFFRANGHNQALADFLAEVKK